MNDGRLTINWGITSDNAQQGRLGFFPAACRCSSLTVFSGYSCKRAMPGDLQKPVEKNLAGVKTADRPGQSDVAGLSG